MMHDEVASDGRMVGEEPMAHDDAMADEGAMASGDEMAPGHDGVGAGGFPAPAAIRPGETVPVLATFDEPGELLIGCHQPGHWEAGMRGTVTVLAIETHDAGLE